MSAAAPPHPSPDASSSGLRGVLQGLRIVVVDDDPDARDLLVTVLTRRSARVYEAGCAADAFDLLAREQPDVLISDIAMPEEDGYSLIKRVRQLASDAGGTTPAVAVTAYAGSADRARAIAAGFDVHFSKPIDIDGLVEKLLDLRAARNLNRGG